MDDFLFFSHLSAVHAALKTLLQPGDCVVDATVGNGHDLEYILSLYPSSIQVGKIFAIDLQAQAIENSKKRLGARSRDVIWYCGCHSQLWTLLESHACIGRVKVVVYNLGYLPGSCKSVITRSETSLDSIKQAQDALCLGGALMVTAYLGHKGGREEYDAIKEYLHSLDKWQWNVFELAPINRPLRPIVFFVQKKQ